jgi:hypothetical protein
MYVSRLALLCVLSLSLTACLKDAEVLSSEDSSLFGTSASLTGAPSNPSNASGPLNVTVGGMLITSYKYHMFKVGAAVDCSTVAAYGPETDVSFSITETPSQGDGDYVLCVIGKSVLEAWQSETSATIHTWVLDTQIPSITPAGLPAPTSDATSLAVSFSGTDLFYYRYKFGPEASIDCSNTSDYSAPVAVGNNITNAIGANGFYELCYMGGDDASNWTGTFSYTWTKSNVPTATLSGQPTPYLNNIGSLNITVAGTDIVAYKFEIITDARPCSDASFGSEVAVGMPIAGSLSGDGVLRLCVIGKNSVGVWQDVASATMHEWEYDGSAPTGVSITNGPSGEYGASAGTRSVTVSGTDLHYFKYKFVYRHYQVDPATFTDGCSVATNYVGPVVAATTIPLNLDALNEGYHTLCVVGGDDAGNWQALTSAVSTNWVIVRPALRAGLTSDGSIYNASQAKFSTDHSIAKVISFFKLDIDTTTGTNMGMIYGGYDAKFDGASPILAYLDPRVVSVSKSPEFGGAYYGLMSYGQVVKINSDGTVDHGAACPFTGGCAGFERFDSISVGRTNHLYVVDHEGRIFDVRDLSTARSPQLDPRVKQVSYW